MKACRFILAASAIALLPAIPAFAQDEGTTVETPAAAEQAAEDAVETTEDAVATTEDIVETTEDAVEATEEAGQAETQPTRISPAEPADGCELHIWPAERMNSMTSGLLGGGLIDAALHAGTDANNKTLLASALDSPSQLDALTSLDLRTDLGLTPGTTYVLHQQPLERKTMNSVKTRRSDSTATCYSELIVADVFYQKAMIYGRSLRTLFMVREFGDDQKIDYQYKAWGGNGLKLFPPKEGEDAIAALDELVTVFQGNFEEFAKNERTAKARAGK
ncbi:hypothetical protein [Novosphingobium mangrovi (ex Huang et al. 2023)]|uniref:Methanolan biosynthesis EpsI domain-containing protein n=1 Tax=Novosphingobium mangrovi (ex Huang et al. 2023) TaxID=2976432 RepID=A0ABT2I4H1_9SPHN|nr:hypothetical protein [Novosphingobium mangrovi (ex Huang et al. 2023)]MCT2399685.1 hypothetical protein [Novosphingobium mangrovi (ex Huang et al. 2023)]